jgi:hypothetical protein
MGCLTGGLAKVHIPIHEELQEICGVSTQWLFSPETARWFASVIRAAGIDADSLQAAIAQGYHVFPGQPPELARRPQ